MRVAGVVAVEPQLRDGAVALANHDDRVWLRRDDRPHVWRVESTRRVGPAEVERRLPTQRRLGRSVRRLTRRVTEQARDDLIRPRVSTADEGPIRVPQRSELRAFASVRRVPVDESEDAKVHRRGSDEDGPDRPTLVNDETLANAAPVASTRPIGVALAVMSASVAVMLDPDETDASVISAMTVASGVDGVTSATQTDPIQFSPFVIVTVSVVEAAASHSKIAR